MNALDGYWHNNAVARWHYHTRRHRVEEQVELPYTSGAKYLSQPYQDYDTYIEAAVATLIGKGRIEFSDLTQAPHQAFFLAKAAYAFEVYDVTDHWFGDDD